MIEKPQYQRDNDGLFAVDDSARGLKIQSVNIMYQWVVLTALQG